MEKGLSSCLAVWPSAQTVLSQACLGLGLVLLAVRVLKTPVVAGVFSLRLAGYGKIFQEPCELSGLPVKENNRNAPSLLTSPRAGIHQLTGHSFMKSTA
ncbi:hypothetical protein MES5069_20085 [Mesorhizobium escarrei]|uniref:DUF2892 domain-containing protein n=1 Tax=Mesorhizobium escarrei TaxID=666018 RepID=A0ABM9DQI3_9HYPH|nr:hypothetical protein MES5069_20085 [Mesorhizobium escarrei]